MPKIRNIIIFAAILIAIILIYVFFIKSPSDQPSLVTSTPTTNDVTVLPNTEDASVANDFLNLLLSVKSIKLDSSIFKDEAFRSLHDSSIILVPDGTEGRPNPFAPFGNDNVPATPASQTTTTTTLPDATTPSTTPATTTPSSPSSTIQFPAAGSSTPSTNPPAKATTPTSKAQ
ncbi:MAG: hypothetical protein ABIS26_01585 [Candidatus Paceibacterota bacterium]